MVASAAGAVGRTPAPSSPACTSVYVAEGQPIFLEAVARGVGARGDLTLLGTARDGWTALADIRRLAPNVAIIDDGLPKAGGADLMEAIARDRLSTRVVMLAADGSSPPVYDVMNLGCAAYLTKSATLADICDAVAAVARGATLIASELQAGLVVELRRHSHTDRPILTQRELQILRFVADGQTGAEIATRLFISVSTVKSHLSSVREKLGVHDRAAAVAEAMRRGLIQ